MAPSLKIEKQKPVPEIMGGPFQKTRTVSFQHPATVASRTVPEIRSIGRYTTVPENRSIILLPLLLLPLLLLTRAAPYKQSHPKLVCHLRDVIVRFQSRAPLPRRQT